MTKKKNELEIKEDQEVLDNVINFDEAKKAVATAGGDPPWMSDSWIDDLEPGTVFLVEEKNSFNFVCPQFLLLEKLEKAVRLYNYTKGDTQTFYVSKNKFCNRFALTETTAFYSDVDAMLEILLAS